MKQTHIETVRVGTMSQSKSSTSPASRFSVQKHDEGGHAHDEYKIREWWYYNIVCNHPESDLKNWMIKCSINSTVDVDSIKLIVHDEKKTTFGSLYERPKGIVISKTNGVDVSFDKSHIKGMYPNWTVHMENTGMDEKEIIVDLRFQAQSRPVWILKNTGRNRSDSTMGYYFVMNNQAEGTLRIDNTEYVIKGTGYYDHTWSPYENKEGSSVQIRGNVWDWFLIRLENGWNMFIGKIYPKSRLIPPALMPGYCCIVTDKGAIFEQFFFQIKYTDFKKSVRAVLNIPKKVDIKLMKINPFIRSFTSAPFLLKMNYTTASINEFIYTDTPLFGQWDSYGPIEAIMKQGNKKKRIHGHGIMEYMSYIDALKS